MRTGTIIRDVSSNAGTFGVLTLDDGTKFQTGELPWRNNEPQISCIPPGVYGCTWDYSPRHGWCYHVGNVFHRSGIEIHSANFMGDQKLNYRCELKGCIALGIDRGVLARQIALLKSGEAILKFNTNLNKVAFQLLIEPIQMEGICSQSTGPASISSS